MDEDTDQGEDYGTGYGPDASYEGGRFGGRRGGDGKCGCGQFVGGTVMGGWADTDKQLIRGLINEAVIVAVIILLIIIIAVSTKATHRTGIIWGSVITGLVLVGASAGAAYWRRNKAKQQ
jgi:hypothetical protein